MTSLLGHGGTNGISPLLCAYERGRAELQDERYRVRDTVLYCSGRGQTTRNGSGLPVAHGIARKRGVCIVLMRVSQFHSSLARSLLRGLCDARRQARSSALLLARGLRFPSAMDPP